MNKLSDYIAFLLFSAIKLFDSLIIMITVNEATLFLRTFRTSAVSGGNIYGELLVEYCGTLAMSSDMHVRQNITRRLRWNRIRN